jgi:hypothetical protein
VSLRCLSRFPWRAAYQFCEFRKWNRGFTVKISKNKGENKWLGLCSALGGLEAFSIINQGHLAREDKSYQLSLDTE